MNAISHTVDLRPEAYWSFYAHVGMCVIAYQSIEDRLPLVLRMVLGDNSNQSEALMKLATGLERRLELISAMIPRSNDDDMAEWQTISRRVKQHFDFRNKVAHCEVSIIGGGIQLELDDAGNAIGLVKLGPDRMEGRKRTKSGEYEAIPLAALTEELPTLYATGERLNLFSQLLRERNL